MQRQMRARPGCTTPAFFNKNLMSSIKIKTKSIKKETIKNIQPVFEGGINVSSGVVSGRLCCVEDISKIDKVKDQDILLAKEIQPGWGSVLKKPAGIITDRGGPTSHVGVLARDMQIPCLLGTRNATEILKSLDGTSITLDATNRRIYQGELELGEKEEKIDIANLPVTKTKIGLMFAHPTPERDFAGLREFPSFGGNKLIRTEFSLLLEIGIHPRALADHYQGNLKSRELRVKINNLISDYKDAKEFYIEKMAASIAENIRIFPEHESIIRTLDTKSSEYRQLLGGESYEGEESNPMMGWRGALRFISPEHREVSLWELEVIKRLMEMGYKNLALTIPIVRDPLELTGGKNLREMMKGNNYEDWQDWKGVFEIMNEAGIEPHKDIPVGIEIEVPSNVIRSDEFAEILDFSTFGPNDLTQFCLAVDRENAELSRIYKPTNPAVLKAMKAVIRSYKKFGKRINIVGQNFAPEFLEFLVGEGIECIGTTWDSYFDVVKTVSKIEKNLNFRSERIPVD